MTLLFKSSSSLVLLLQFLVLYDGVVPSQTPLAASHLLLPNPLQPQTPFWRNNLSWCASLQLSLPLKTQKCSNFPSQLGLLTPILALFIGSLLLSQPDKSIRIYLCSQSSLRGIDSASFCWTNCNLCNWCLPRGQKAYLILICSYFITKNTCLCQKIHFCMWFLQENQRFHILAHWSAAPIANFYINIHFLEHGFCH